MEYFCFLLIKLGQLTKELKFNCIENIYQIFRMVRLRYNLFKAAGRVPI